MKAGTIFMLFNHDLWNSGSCSYEGIDGFGQGYATFIKIDWGGLGRSFWSGFGTLGRKSFPE